MKASASSTSLSSNSTDPQPSIFELLETESTNTLIKSLNDIFQQSDTGGLKSILNQRNFKNQSVLHVACLKHHLDITHLLLNYGANANVLDQDHQTPAFLVVVGLQNCNCEECTKKAVRCLTLLSYHGGIMDIPDANKKTPLFLCAQNRFVVCAKALLLNGATPGETPDGFPLLPILVEKMPSVLETVLDCSVKTTGNIILDDPKFIVEFDFRTIVPCFQNTFSMKTGEMRCLKSLLKRTHRNRDIDDVHDDPVSCVLRHPVVAVFMDIKWKALERWYAGFLVYQVIALLAYTGLIVVSVFFDCPHEKYIKSRSQHLNFTRDQPNFMVSDTSCETRPINRFFAIILILNALLILAHEVQRAVNYFKEYAKHLLYHIVDTMGYICVIFTALIIAAGADHTSPIYEWFYPISAFTISVLWCQIFVQIGRLPQLAIYVEMMMKISANFCKTLAIYSFLLIGLAISYSILFSSNPQLRLFPFSMTKVISMLVGELDHEDLVNHSTNQDETHAHNLSTIQKVGGYFWYVCVLVMVTLVLMNLLVGLAVSDIQGIRANAEIYVIRRRIGYIAYIEKLLGETVVWRRFFNQSKLSVVKRVISPVELMGFTINVFPNDPTYKEISKQTKLTIKSWIITKSQSVPNFVKKCKGTSPDSSNTLTRKPTIKFKRDCNQRRVLIRSKESTEITDTERLKQLEYQMVKLNDKLKMILENIMKKREPLNLSP